MIAHFWHYARPYRRRYLVGLVLLLATNGLALTLPRLLGAAVDAMERGEPLRTIAAFAGLMVVIALLQAVVRTFSRIAMLGASRRAVYDVRRDFFAKLQRLSASFYDRHRTGDLMSRGINDLRLLRSFYGPGAMNLLNTVIVYVGVLVILVGIDPVLTAYALAPLIPLLFVIRMISARVYRRSLDVQEQLSTISSKAQENLSGIQQVRIYAQEDREISSFRALCEEFRSRNLSLARLRGLMIAVIGIVTGVETLVVLFVGGQHVIEGRIDFPAFVSFNAYLAMLAWPTIALGWIINVFQRGLGAMERVREVLDSDPDIPPAVDEADRDADEIEPLDGDIEIRDLTFRHSGAFGPNERPTLHDVSLRVPRGQRVALVGGVGSGKSTLVNLIARVYAVPPGTIFIGGEDLASVSTLRARASIGYVPQEAFLFSRTLRENVAFGRPDASDEDVARAVALASLDEDVAGFPEGLSTVVGERGVTLSGGQRQRATLARAALLEPRILILDDALSSVDADTEQKILHRLENAMRGRTAIVVTHRPAVLAQMDRIVVLEQGRIVEDDTHDNLIAARGVYAELFHRRELEERLGAS